MLSHVSLDEMSFQDDLKRLKQHRRLTVQLTKQTEHKMKKKCTLKTILLGFSLLIFFIV